MRQRTWQRFGALVAVSALLFAVALPASAAPAPRVTKKTACTVLRRSQISQMLDATTTSTGNARKGPDIQCRWSVGAGGERPAGALTVGVSFDVPPGAYDALKNNQQYQVVDGVGADALYQPLVGALTVFKGTRILSLKGIFTDTTVRPIRSYDAKSELVTLAQAAVARL